MGSEEEKKSEQSEKFKRPTDKGHQSQKEDSLKTIQEKMFEEESSVDLDRDLAKFLKKYDLVPKQEVTVPLT